MKKLISLLFLLSSTLAFAESGSKTSGPIHVETQWLNGLKAGKVAQLQVMAQVHDEVSDQMTISIRPSKGLKVVSKRSVKFSGPILVHDIKTHVFKIKIPKRFKAGRVVVDVDRKIKGTRESKSHPVSVIFE